MVKVDARISYRRTLSIEKLICIFRVFCKNCPKYFAQKTVCSARTCLLIQLSSILKRKTGYLKNGQKEDRTSSTSKPTEKPTKSRGSKQTGGTANSQISSQTSSRTTKRSRSTVYTYWGSSKCPTVEDEIVKTVYSGEFDILFKACALWNFLVDLILGPY